MPDLPAAFRAGFTVPQVFRDGVYDTDEIKRIATRAETAGFDSLWLQDQAIAPGRTLAPVPLLGFLSAITESVRLGVAVFVLPFHEPIRLAQSLAAVDRLSGGRLIVGVGLGGPSPHEDEQFSVARGTRVRRFEETLGLLKALWADERVTWEGEHYRLADLPTGTLPQQRPHPPIWFGARAAPALRRAARLGDAWMGPGSSSSNDFRNHVVMLREALEQEGRDPEGFTISKRVYLAIDDDRERAGRRLREWFAHSYGRAEMADEVALWGSQAQVAEGLMGLVDAGARHLLLNPVFDYADHLDALSAFATPGS